MSLTSLSLNSAVKTAPPAPQVPAERLSTTTHYDTVQQVQSRGRVSNLSCEGELEQIGGPRWFVRGGRRESAPNRWVNHFKDNTQAVSFLLAGAGGRGPGRGNAP